MKSTLLFVVARSAAPASNGARADKRGTEINQFAIGFCADSTAARTFPRQGMSLLEVLISMFVLLFGLMGVAAIFPVGNHYASRGEQFDRHSVLAEAAFADLKSRGMLKPELWLYAASHSGGPRTTDFIVQSPSVDPKKTVGYFNSPYLSSLYPSPLSPPDEGYESGPGFAFVIDPLGTAAAIRGGATDYDVFPLADLSKRFPEEPPPPKKSPVRRMTLSVPGSLDSPSRTRMRLPFAETIFRLRDDVTNELPKENDRPGIQRWTAVDSTAGTPNTTPSDASDDTLLARSYAGNYSWLATVVPTSIESHAALQPMNSRFGSDFYEVSVVVFNKRETIPSAASERGMHAILDPGGHLTLWNPNDQEGIDAIDAATQDVRAGDWVAISGYTGTTGIFRLKWYRLLSIDDETLPQIVDGAPGAACVRHAMLDGPEFPGLGGHGNIRMQATFLPGVISVTTRMLPMERAE